MKRLAVLFLLTGCISQSSWQTFKAHAEETGIATSGGAVGAVVGGPVGLALAIAGMSTAALVGEMNKPPDAEVHTTTTVDENGHIIDQRVTRVESNAMPDTGFLHSITSWFDSILKIGVLIAVVFWLLTHPGVIEKLVGAGASGVQLVRNAAKAVQKTVHPIATKKKRDQPPAPPLP